MATAERNRDRTLKAAAVLLIGGWLTFWAGAINPAAARFFLPIPLRQFLEAVDAQRTAWLAIAGTFAIGVLLTAAGLTLFAVVLRAAGERVWSELGKTAFLFGAVLWLAAIGFRATVTVSAARETVASGTIPPWFEPLRNWVGALFAVYMVLAYLAISAFGKAMLITGIAPRWLARTHVIFGLIAAAGFLSRVPVFNPPLLIHLLPGMLGVSLLISIRRGTTV